MLYRRTQIRPYKVIKPFVYAGVQFETGGVFDPREFNTPVQKVEHLISARILDQAAIVSETEVPVTKTKKKSVAEMIEEVTSTPEPTLPPVVEEVPAELEPQVKSMELEAVVEPEPEQVTTTPRSRRRS